MPDCKRGGEKQNQNQPNEKWLILLRKSSGASGGISEVIEQTKSGDNSADYLEPDIPIVVSESVDDHPSMAEDGLKDDDHIKSRGKSRRIERPNTGTSLMQNMLKTTKLPKGFL